jgi:mono/diheme cytochrome c family protein
LAERLLFSEEKELALKRLLMTFATLAATAGFAFAAGNAQAGKAVFEKSCKTCHGPDGHGNPTIAKMMKVTFRGLDSQEVQSKSDAELKKDIVEGTGKMKPIKGLSDAQIADVIAYVRSLSKK